MTVDAFQACTRFGLGPRPGDLKNIESDPRGWLLAQLQHPIFPPSLQNLQKPALNLKAMVANATDPEQKKDMQKQFREEVRDIYISETAARFLVHQQTEQPFIERLVMFWSNHFTVSIQKTQVAGLVNAFEAEAIRPYVTGKFSDMLIASSRHPAMLAYLDNIRSIGPNSRLGEKSGKGLNENLAREIMELHTLGVSAGYTQADVTSFAKVITGWSVTKDDTGPPQFEFHEPVHEPGPKTVFGRTYAENGEAEGIVVLRDLAKNPWTARHIATKLARHFISDVPSEAAIQYIGTVFLRSDGNLFDVSRALIDYKECWNNPLAKYKSPYEYVVSAARLLDFNLEPKQVIGTLDSLNFRPFNATSPAGYADTADVWMSPDAVMKRIELAQKFAQRVPNTVAPTALAEEAFGPVMNAETAFVIKGAASGKDGIGFVLSAPEFMRR